eukprot:scaffold8369_cov325-Pinguiococcus_pyrenoidosus.AAC.1
MLPSTGSSYPEVSTSLCFARTARHSTLAQDAEDAATCLGRLYKSFESEVALRERNTNRSFSFLQFLQNGEAGTPSSGAWCPHDVFTSRKRRKRGQNGSFWNVSQMPAALTSAHVSSRGQSVSSFGQGLGLAFPDRSSSLAQVKTASLKSLMKWTGCGAVVVEATIQDWSTGESSQSSVLLSDASWPSGVSFWLSASLSELWESDSRETAGNARSDGPSTCT